jgi:hypothetical protein
MEPRPVVTVALDLALGRGFKALFSKEKILCSYKNCMKFMFQIVAFCFFCRLRISLEVGRAISSWIFLHETSQIVGGRVKLSLFLYLIHK